MSRRMTSIDLPGSRWPGWAEWDLKTVPEMIAAARHLAEHQKREAEAVLAAADCDFFVQTYIGVHVHRNRKILQRGAIEPKAERAEG